MNIPNYISLFRILLIPFFFTELLTYTPDRPQHRTIALILFVIAALSDALDGMIARLSRSKTSLGRFLDPLADKLLLLSGFLGILFVHALPYRPPLWITVTIVFRDVIIVGGMIVIFLSTGNIRIQPNLLGKFTTAFQMFTIMAILLEWQWSFIFWNVTAVLTIASCVVYCYRELNTMKPQA